MTARERSAKTVTRRAVRTGRSRRDATAVDAVEAALAHQVVAVLTAGSTAGSTAGTSGAAGGPGSVAAYASLPGEPGTGRLREVLAGLGYRVLLPVLLPDLDLDWVLDAGTGAAGDALRPDGPRLGPDAVASCALVLVPALAVDVAGTRLGQGGGSYDRSLARLAPRTPGPERPLVLAVVHDDEVLDGLLPREPHDIGVDGALTPSGLVLLGPCGGPRAWVAT